MMMMKKKMVHTILNWNISTHLCWRHPQASSSGVILRRHPKDRSKHKIVYMKFNNFSDFNDDIILRFTPPLVLILYYDCCPSATVFVLVFPPHSEAQLDEMLTVSQLVAYPPTLIEWHSLGHFILFFLNIFSPH